MAVEDRLKKNYMERIQNLMLTELKSFNKHRYKDLMIAERRRPNAQRNQRDSKLELTQKKTDIETQFELSESFNQLSIVDVEQQQNDNNEGIEQEIQETEDDPLADALDLSLTLVKQPVQKETCTQKVVPN